MSAAGDSARVSVFVAVEPAEAFRVFTDEIDQWWRHGKKFRIAGRHPGRMVITGGEHGRLFEVVEHPSGPRTHQVGEILVWDPPRYLEMEWRGVNFAEHEKTTVEVSFAASGRGTMVTLCHRGWSALRGDHPARHGLQGAEFSRMIGLWWGGLMSALREHVS